MITITHTGKVLCINGRELTLEYPIKESFDVNGIVIVLLDPDSNLGSHGQFRNVIGFDANGNQVWIAELPTEKTSDVYYQVSSRTPLKLSSFCSYECEVDPKTGKILSKSFYK